MRIHYTNLIDAAATVITAATENTYFPVENVQNALRTKYYSTGVTTANEWIVFDLGSAQAVTSLIVLDHTHNASDTVVLEGHTADSWGSPAFTTTLGAGHKHVAGSAMTGTNYNAITFASQTYRYWRYKITKSASANAVTIGRMFLGTYYQTTEQPTYDGLDHEIVDPSTDTRTYGGQNYTDSRNAWRKLKLQFAAITQTQADSFFAIGKAQGMHTPFFVQIDENASAGTEGALNNLMSEILYVRLAKIPKLEVAGYDAAYNWNATLELEEQR